MKRRPILKGITLLPLAGTLAPFKSLFASAAVDDKQPSSVTGELSIGPGIFQSIGVEPIINYMAAFYYNIIQLCHGCIAQ